MEEISMINVGQVCVKIAGRDAGKQCVVVQVLGNNRVLIVGETRKKACNVSHLEPLPINLKLKKGATEKEIEAALKKAKISVRKTKPKKKSARPKKTRKVKKKEQPIEEKTTDSTKTKEPESSLDKEQKKVSAKKTKK
jgi:large subunit ribosomal protein L14e